ncbi:MAG: hypothetical protein SFT91_04690 [Rickettsiaceae bacterium]|nr:hypothetical protein [Rickettsiaceae bacterium]
MEYYRGLDVSLKETFITIIHQDGEIAKEQVVPTSADAISQCLQIQILNIKKVSREGNALVTKPHTRYSITRKHLLPALGP